MPPDNTERQQRLIKWNKGERIEVKSGYPRVSEMRDGQLEIRNVRGEGLCIVLRHSSELYTVPFQDKHMDLVKRKKRTFKASKAKDGISDLEGESIVSKGAGETPIGDTYFLGADGDGSCSWKVPAGSGGTVYNSNITIAGSGGLSVTGTPGTDDIFTTNQSHGETITLTISDNAITFAKIADLARGSILVGNASAATAELTKGGANTYLKSDGTDIAWSTSAATGYSYLPFGNNGNVIGNITLQLETVGNSLNTRGYVMPRAGTITALSVEADNTVYSSFTTFFIFINGVKQTGYYHTLADAVDTGYTEFGSPLAFSAGDSILVYCIINTHSSGGIANIAVLVEVTT